MKIRFSNFFTVHYLLHMAREDCRRKWQKKAIDVNTIDNLKYIDMKRQWKIYLCDAKRQWKMYYYEKTMENMLI